MSAQYPHDLNEVGAPLRLLSSFSYPLDSTKYKKKKLIWDEIKIKSTNPC